MLATRQMEIRPDVESEADQKARPSVHDGSQSIDGAFASILMKLSPYLPLTLIGDDKNRRVKKQNLTILSADIRGFTSLAELIDPEQCIDILNEYFDVAVEFVSMFGGEVDKFQGDGFMAVFTELRNAETHERRAVQCALGLREMAQTCKVPRVGGERIPLGMGINTGIAAVGNVGSKIRKDYTVIGDVVNVAHYLQRISGPDQIIVSGSTRRLMGGDLDCAPLGYIRVKRRINRVEAFLID